MVDTAVAPLTLSLLKALKAAPGRCSGEELAARIGVSRTTVWKHVDRLRQAGYQIDGSPRTGYVLLASPDRLYPWEWEAARRGAWAAAPVEYGASMGSTNDRAKELARQGAPEGTVVVAEEQSAGRGRRGRAWHSPGGLGIWCSVVVRPALRPWDFTRLIFLAGVAVVQVVQAYCRVKVGIKWPNDVYAGGGKLAGILVETEAEPERLHFAVIGIGINVNQLPRDFPADLRAVATSLRLAAAGLKPPWSPQSPELSLPPLPRVEVFKALLNRLQSLYEQELPTGFARAVSMVRPYCLTLGQPVKVVQEHGVWEGTALDLTADGMLQVRDTQGRVRVVHSGDVSLKTGEPA